MKDFQWKIKMAEKYGRSGRPHFVCASVAKELVHIHNKLVIAKSQHIVFYEGIF